MAGPARILVDDSVRRRITLKNLRRQPADARAPCLVLAVHRCGRAFAEDRR